MSSGVELPPRCRSWATTTGRLTRQVWACEALEDHRRWPGPTTPEPTPSLGRGTPNRGTSLGEPSEASPAGNGCSIAFHFFSAPDHHNARARSHAGQGTRGGAGSMAGMRIKLCSDIHGAAGGLRRAAAGADALLVCGDLVNLIDYRTMEGIAVEVFGPEVTAAFARDRTAGRCEEPGRGRGG